MAAKPTGTSSAWLWSKPTSVRRQVEARKAHALGNQRGQIVVEYILLLFITVTIATILTKKLINRNPDNPGIITGAWVQMNSAIGNDIID